MCKDTISKHYYYSFNTPFVIFHKNQLKSILKICIRNLKYDLYFSMLPISWWWHWFIYSKGWCLAKKLWNIHNMWTTIYTIVSCYWSKLSLMSVNFDADRNLSSQDNYSMVQSCKDTAILYNCFLDPAYVQQIFGYLSILKKLHYSLLFKGAAAKLMARVIVTAAARWYFNYCCQF